MKKEIFSLFIVILSLTIISGINITVNSPQATSYFTNTTINFNVTLNENGSCWYSIDFGENVTMQTSDNILFSSFNSTLNVGNHTITYYCNDSLGNLTSSSLNFSLKVMEITLNNPSNNIYTNQQLRNFTCSALTYDADFTNVTFRLWNSSGLISEETQTLSGKNSSASFLKNLTANSIHYWNCLFYNSDSVSAMASNYSITYDSSNPRVTLNSPNNKEDDYDEEDSVPFKYTANDNFEIERCILLIDGDEKATDNSVTKGSEETISYNFDSSGSYDWSVKCYDKAGNSYTSDEREIVIQKADDDVRSGGSGESNEDYLKDIANYNKKTNNSVKATTMQNSSNDLISINNSAILQGYTIQVKKGKILSFEIESEKSTNVTNSTTNETVVEIIKINETHTITLEEITNNTVNLTIRSEPINFELKIGEEKKINLSSPDYYDLYIKLNSINSSLNEANITIKKIKEDIFKRSFFSGIINFLSLSYKKTKQFFSSYLIWILIILTVILALIIMGVIEYFIIKKKIRGADVRPIRAEHQKHKK